MTADELVEQILTTYRDAYDRAAPSWKGFAVSCWFGDGVSEIVPYYYEGAGSKGKQIWDDPAPYEAFSTLKGLSHDSELIHAIVLSYVRDSGAVNSKIIREPVDATRYQNSVGNSFDIAEAIRPFRRNS